MDAPNHLPAPREWPYWRLLRMVFVLLFAIAVVRTAWVGEDAYITLRTVSNWFGGYGLRWNPDERVQTYSHPLWMFALALGRLCSGEYYISTLVVCALCSGGAVWLMGFRIRRSVAGAVCALALLTFCKAFVEYSTSGLESPLTFLLLAVFALLLQGSLAGERRLLALALVGALGATNRMDTALLFVPGVLSACAGVPWKRALGCLVLGGAPFFAWLLFASFYYGTPFPITAYAKIGTGISTWALLHRGAEYYLDALWRDPVLLPGIVVGGFLAWRSKAKAALLLTTGSLLYCLYVLKIGGDFMAGRFLAPPLFVAALCIAQFPFSKVTVWRPLGLLYGTVLVGFACPTVPLLCDGHFLGDIDDTGIADERGFHYPRGGLLAPTFNLPPPNSARELVGLDADPAHPRVMVWFMVGYFGFMVGSEAHIVDPWLCDPLLMRLPIYDLEHWRIGHFVRRIPEGYLESLAFGEDRMHHKGLGRVAAQLKLVIRGDLLDPARLKAMWGMWTGAWEADLADFVANEYRTPPLITVPQYLLNTVVPDGTKWWQGRFALVHEGGLRVQLGDVSHDSKVAVMLDCADVYEFAFYQGNTLLAECTQRSRPVVDKGMHRFAVAVPAAASEAGFDNVRVTVSYNRLDGISCLAYLIPE